MASIDVFNTQKKYSFDRYPYPVNFNTTLLIVYLSVIETVICQIELKFNRVTSFGFAQTTTHDFQNS